MLFLFSSAAERLHFCLIVYCFFFSYIMWVCDGYTKKQTKNKTDRHPCAAVFKPWIRAASCLPVGTHAVAPCGGLSIQACGIVFPQNASDLSWNPWDNVALASFHASFFVPCSQSFCRLCIFCSNKNVALDCVAPNMFSHRDSVRTVYKWWSVDHPNWPRYLFFLFLFLSVVMLGDNISFK